jgi:plasmid maintenance system antidote protein VapI
MKEIKPKGKVVCNLEDILYQRKKAGKPISNQTEMADALGMKRQNINHFCTGVAQMRPEILYRAAYLLDESTDIFYTFIPEEDESKERAKK